MSARSEIVSHGMTVGHQSTADALDEILGRRSPMTIVTKLLDAQTDIEAAKQGLGGGNGDAAREFALANTALEDAIMRVNRGFAKQNGTFKTADVEASL